MRVVLLIKNRLRRWETTLGNHNAFNPKLKITNSNRHIPDKALASPHCSIMISWITRIKGVFLNNPKKINGDHGNDNDGNED